jgi:hypothetical protein
VGSGPTSSDSQTINQDGFEAQQKVFQQQERQQSKAEEKRKVEPVRVWTLNGEEEEDNEESQGIWREALLGAHGRSTKHTGRSGSHLSTEATQTTGRFAMPLKKESTGAHCNHRHTAAKFP